MLWGRVRSGPVARERGWCVGGECSCTLDCVRGRAGAGVEFAAASPATASKSIDLSLASPSLPMLSPGDAPGSRAKVAFRATPPGVRASRRADGDDCKTLRALPARWHSRGGEHADDDRMKGTGERVDESAVFSLLLNDAARICRESGKMLLGEARGCCFVLFLREPVAISSETQSLNGQCVTPDARDIAPTELPDQVVVHTFQNGSGIAKKKK